MTTKEAKSIDIKVYLEKLGHLPVYVKKNGDELWYHSPMRQEKTPSFKITLSKNSWYDFGTGEGGSILDFVMIYFKSNIGEAFRILSSEYKSIAPFIIKSPVKKTTQNKQEITIIRPITRTSLCNYIAERAINLQIARHYTKEIHYKVLSKNQMYYGIGMKNQADGYEVRCSIFKGSVGKKDISVLCSNHKELSIFEGFFDFLSVLTEQNISELKTDVIILHSTANLKKAIKVIEAKKYQKIYAFFDNDETGEKALLKLLKVHPMVKDLRYLYADYNDYNEKLISKK